MAVPDFQSMMLPFLGLLSDRQKHGYSEIAALLADHFRLSQDEKNELVPSGKQSRLINRVHWVSTYFKKAKLVESADRGTFRITDRGLELLSRKLDRIDMKTLDEYPEYVAFRNQKNRAGRGENTSPDPFVEPPVDSKTPDEVLEDSYNTIRRISLPKFWRKLSLAPRTFSNGSLSNCLSIWVMEVHGMTSAKRLVGAVMKVSTGLSKKIG